MTHFPPVILHESTQHLVLLCLGTKPDTCKLGSLSRSQFLKTLRCKSLCVKKHGQGVSTLTGTSSTPLVRFLGWLTSSRLTTACSANAVLTKPPRTSAGRITKADKEGEQRSRLTRHMKCHIMQIHTRFVYAQDEVSLNSEILGPK